MQTDILSLFGYFASVIIAISMTMSSIVKFRWINLIGAFSFAIYGLLINAIPVTFLNGFIVAVDIYYLIKIYSKKEVFQILEISKDNKYLKEFLNFHKKDIEHFFPGFKYNPDMNTLSFFVLRNLNVAGAFLAHKEGNNTLMVGLDYVIPQYRDLKNGKFVYSHLKKHLVREGIKKVSAIPLNKKHIKYLEKLGFVKEGTSGVYSKTLDS